MQYNTNKKEQSSVDKFSANLIIKHIMQSKLSGILWFTNKTKVNFKTSYIGLDLYPL